MSLFFIFKKHKHMKKHFQTITVFSAFVFLLYACNCSCLCDKNMGCAIAEARSVNGVLVEKQLYCSTTNYETDKAVQDSVRNFQKRYLNSTISVAIRDSFSSTIQVSGLTCNDANDFKSQGYECSCTK
jgi:hypothetical protein